MPKGKHHSEKGLTGMQLLFARTVIGAIHKKDKSFIMEGEKLERLAEICQVDSKVCDWIRIRCKKMGNMHYGR